MEVHVVCPGIVATEFHVVQGMDLSALPRMSAGDVVTAALAGIERGAVSARYLPDSNRSPEQKSAAALVDELLAADAIVLAVPLYNFGVSQHFKTWVDLIITDQRAGAGAPPLLAGKNVVLCTVRGGAHGAGTPREGWDHSTSYLRRIIADVWGAELTIVEREFTLVGVNPALDSFTDVAAAMHEGALASAREAGKALAVAA